MYNFNTDLSHSSLRTWPKSLATTHPQPLWPIQHKPPNISHPVRFPTTKKSKSHFSPRNSIFLSTYTPITPPLPSDFPPHNKKHKKTTNPTITPHKRSQSQHTHSPQTCSTRRNPPSPNKSSLSTSTPLPLFPHLTSTSPSLDYPSWHLELQTRHTRKRITPFSKKYLYNQRDTTYPTIQRIFLIQTTNHNYNPPRDTSSHSTY